jgi:5-methylcytosine-specific restriction endonuclease McrA
MFGFGIALMHIADYFARRKHDKKERISQDREEYQREQVKQCTICGDHFHNDLTLQDHIKSKHPNTL